MQTSAAHASVMHFMFVSLKSWLPNPVSLIDLNAGLKGKRSALLAHGRICGERRVHVAGALDLELSGTGKSPVPFAWFTNALPT